MSVLPNVIYRFNAVPINFPASFFLCVDIDKMILKFICRSKRPRIANKIVKEKNKVGGLTLFSSMTYCKITVMRTKE